MSRISEPIADVVNALPGQSAAPAYVPSSAASMTATGQGPVGWRAPFVLWLALALMATRPLPMSAQADLGIGSELECPECRIGTELVTTLGDASGPGLLGPVVTIARLADGRYALSHAWFDWGFVVFDHAGNYLQRVGRRGQGPGEYQYVRWIRSKGDKLHVVDPILRRHTVLSADFELVRTNQLSGEMLGAVLPLTDSSLVVNAMIRTRDHMGYALHTTAPGPLVNASFDLEPGGMDLRSSPEPYLRVLSEARSGDSFWSVHRTRYRVEQWAPNGTLMRRFARESPWFLPNRGRADPRARPPPVVLDTWMDPQDRLWVLIRASKDTWQGLVGRAPPNDPDFENRNIESLYDTIIEVLDVRSGSLLLSATVDTAIYQFLGDGLAVSSDNDRDAPRVLVWQLSIHN